MKTSVSSSEKEDFPVGVVFKKKKTWIAPKERIDIFDLEIIFEPVQY